MLLNVKKLNDKQLTVAKKIAKILKNADLVTQPELVTATNKITGKLYAPYWIIKNVAARPTKAALKEAGVTPSEARPHCGLYNVNALIAFTEKMNAKAAVKHSAIAA